MATAAWLGAGSNVRQTWTVTVANTWAQGDTVTFTIAGVTFVITIGTLVTTTQVATTIKEAWNGSTLTDTSASATISAGDGGAVSIAQYSEMTATSSGAVVTLTTNQNNPTGIMGKPTTLTTGDIGSTAGNGTATVAAGVTPTSQFHWDQVDNWSSNDVPDAGDDIVFDTGGIDLRYLMTTTIQPLTITKYKSYTGNIGLAPINIDNSSKPYAEYRTPTYLTFAEDAGVATLTVNLEVGEGQGSGRIMIDAADCASTTLNIFGKGNRADSNIPCVLFKGSAITAINNLAGDLGVAFLAGETSTVTTLRSGDGPASQAQTVVSSGVTLTTAVMNGGTLSTNCAMTTGTQNGGTWQHNSGTITTLNVLGGTFYPIGGATITTLNVGSGGTFDATKGSAAFTVTNTVQLYRGAKYLDPNGRSGNVVFKLNQCTLADVTVILPPNKTFTPS